MKSSNIDEEALLLLLTDFVTLAKECKETINNASFKSENLEQASVSLFLCNKVLETWQ